MGRARALGLLALLTCEPVKPERACPEPTGDDARAIENYCACYWAESGFGSSDECNALTCLDCTGKGNCAEAVACVAEADDDESVGGDGGADCDGGGGADGAGGDGGADGGGGSGLCEEVWDCLCTDPCEDAYRRVYDCCSLDVPDDIRGQARLCCDNPNCWPGCGPTLAADCNDIIGSDPGCPY